MRRIVEVLEVQENSRYQMNKAVALNENQCGGFFALQEKIINMHTDNLKNQVGEYEKSSGNIKKQKEKFVLKLK